jgi:hypothetical protein
MPVFSWKLFFIGVVAIFLVNALGIVDRTIRLAVGQLASEMAMNRRGGGSNSDKSYRESLSDAVETEKHELISREPFGKSLGFIEMVLYFYTLQSGLSGLTAAVLLFKAFTGWIGINGEDSSQEVAAKTLARFYSYAIGNFISLLWAIFLFELIKTVGPSLPMLA